MPLILVLSLLSFGSSTKDFQIHDFMDSLNRGYIDISWQFYPLTKFPYLKAQDWPWTQECAGSYLESTDPPHVTCHSNDSTDYVGLYYQDESRNFVLYKCEKFVERQDRLIGFDEFIIVTRFGSTLAIFYRRNPNEELTVFEPLYK